MKATLRDSVPSDVFVTNSQGMCFDLKKKIKESLHVCLNYSTARVQQPRATLHFFILGMSRHGALCVLKKIRGTGETKKK